LKNLYEEARRLPEKPNRNKLFKLSQSPEIGLNFGSAKLIFGRFLMGTWSSVRQGVAATALLVLTSAAITSLTSNPAYANACPLTQGFWKNHPDVWANVPPLTIGSYNQIQLLNILHTPPSGGNASLILAHQLIAAELNVATGSFFPGLIDSTITTSDALLTGACDTSLPQCFVQESSALGQRMTNLAATLDAFNEGTLTPICIPRTLG
jgi:hypothetical protein